MSKAMPLRPTDDDINWWTSQFVPEFVLWWWDDSAIPGVSNAVRVVDRAIARKDPVIGNIAYVNTFHTWAMHEEVERIIVDDGSWIDSLADEERQHASELQVRFKRGLCIPQQRFGPDSSMPESSLFDGRVVLDQSLWNSLADSAQRSVIKSELADWDRDTTYRLPKTAPDHIAEIANTFILQEGVNCLSVTSFAVTENLSDLYQWMFPDTFSAILERAGYQRTDASIPSASDVIVFRNEEGTIVHAAYVIQPDRILNKSGQSSFNPVAIVDLAALVGNWSEHEFSIYRR